MTRDHARRVGKAAAARAVADAVQPVEGITRVTQPTLDVLAALINADGFELHGWAIIKEAQLRGPTVYKVLERLTAAKLVTARWELEHPDGNKPRRRFYQLTDAGAARARALLAERRPAASDASWRPAFGAVH
ncbi:PadR family transcriptional regulator [Micromonospora sp. bgisy143]|uniref:PadR family transcriptional regulator n=1 Tax=Micromonospora sp. bgisy143 TaxID=3413790 RepID=UPI003EBB256E